MTTESKDVTFNNITENKVEKSIRNMKAFHDAIKRAKKGEFDIDVTSVKKQELLKIEERWSLRKAFDIAQGKHYYKLFKEVFYINDPQKKYFDQVEPTVYRRVVAQKEHGDRQWAEAVAQELPATIIED